jgi:hypothetical protein
MSTATAMTPNANNMGAASSTAPSAAPLSPSGADDWNRRSDRHRGVVDLLFASGSVYNADVRTKPAVPRRRHSRTLSQELHCRSASAEGGGGGAHNGDTFTTQQKNDSSTTTDQNAGTNVPAAAAAGSIFDVRTSSSIGLWFSMFSVLSATAAMDAHDFATIWSKCLRRAHIATEDEQPLPTFTPPPNLRDLWGVGAAAGQSAQTSAVADSSDDESVPICSRTLWNDAIDHLLDTDTLAERFPVALTWPDLSESIVVQKLQLLQFCVTMCSASPIYHFPQEMVAVTVPNTDHTASTSAAATLNASATSTEDVATGLAQQPNTESTDTDAEQLQPMAATANREATNTVTVRQPALFRRLPLTEDAIAMSNYLARKVNAKSSRSSRDHPQLKVQLQYPSIVSDMKAFKATNPELGLDVFCAWYGFEPVTQVQSSEQAHGAAPLAGGTVASESATSDDSGSSNSAAPMQGARTGDMLAAVTAKPVPMPQDELQKVWNLCEPVSCEDQGKPLFLWEKEAERALAYLESVSAVRLATEMLCSGMRLLVGVVASYVQPWISEDRRDAPLGQVDSVWVSLALISLCAFQCVAWNGCSVWDN